MHRPFPPLRPGPLSILALALAAATPVAAQSGDSAAALAAFRGNIAAIHAHDRARYLSYYLQSPALVRAGPGGLQYGYAALATPADTSFPDTLAASHFRVTPLAPGVVYGAYRYRVVQAGEESRGVSERVLVKTPAGWRIAVTTAFAAPPELPPPPFALVGGTVIDGTGGAPVRDGVVVMRDGKIECAGARAACPVPGDAEVVDARGKWIIPGLVDAHVHYSQTGWADGRPDAADVRGRFPYDSTVAALEVHPERFFRSYLCSGVTATFDVGGYPWTWRLRQAAERSTSAPHVAAAGPLLSTRDFWLNVPGGRQFVYMASDSATRAGARYLVANHTDAVKVWFLAGAAAPDTAKWVSVLRAAGDEARRGGVPLIVHATNLWAAKQALRAGATLLVHSVEDAPVDEEFLELAKRAGATYTPTLTVYDGYRQVAERHADTAGRELECVDPETRRKVALTDSLATVIAAARADGGAAKAAPPLSAEARAQLEERMRTRYRTTLANLKRVFDAGIPVATGTDAGNPLTLHGPAIHREMEAMREAGLTPMQVLVASTRTAAAAMGRARDFGTLEQGKSADLVVLDADPLVDIANVRRVALVVRRGEIRTRRELEYGHGR
ncbi:MAG TPA: amidohydrolase family protein [Longimicrobiales bacterium]|nr:amidohydrolase family protein [Longimicrobiales bacterium]